MVDKVTQEEHWQLMFNEVRTFINNKRRLPADNISKTETQLMNWIKTQRKFYKACKLRYDRVVQLQKLPINVLALSLQEAEKVFIYNTVYREIDERCMDEGKHSMNSMRLSIKNKIKLFENGICCCEDVVDQSIKFNRLVCKTESYAIPIEALTAIYAIPYEKHVYLRTFQKYFFSKGLNAVIIKKYSMVKAVEEMKTRIDSLNEFDKRVICDWANGLTLDSLSEKYELSTSKVVRLIDKVRRTMYHNRNEIMDSIRINIERENIA